MATNTSQFIPHSLYMWLHMYVRREIIYIYISKIILNYMYITLQCQLTGLAGTLTACDMQC